MGYDEAVVRLTSDLLQAAQARPLEFFLGAECMLVAALLEKEGVCVLLFSLGDLLAICDKGKPALKAKTMPTFKQVAVGGILPETIPVVDSLTERARQGEVFDEAFLWSLYSSTPKARCHEICLRVWLVNEASGLLRVVGINPHKQILDVQYRSAVLFPPQGVATGDVVRFECNLDTDLPSMRRFKLDGTRRVYTSSEYYFDEGVLEVEPNRMLCLSILFQAHKAVYEVHPELVFELDGETRALPIPLEDRAIVCPSEFIPEDERYVRSFDSNPPSIVLAAGRFDRCMG